MHDAQHVLETGVFRRGKDPPCGLQLVDLPQPLYPRMIDDLAFRHFAIDGAAGAGEGDVAVDGIVA